MVIFALKILSVSFVMRGDFGDVTMDLCSMYRANCVNS